MKSASILSLALLLLLATRPMRRRRAPASLLASVTSAPAHPTDPYWTHFLRGMRELGYVEGRNVAYEFRHYGDSVATAQSIMNDLVRVNVDVIEAGGGAAIRAAQSATRTIPIVMGAVSEPLESGLIEGLARPTPLVVDTIRPDSRVMGVAGLGSLRSHCRPDNGFRTRSLTSCSVSSILMRSAKRRDSGGALTI